MITTPAIAKDHGYPVAIREKELRSMPFFRLEAHELCTMCGERFGIGFLPTEDEIEAATPETAELPGRLTEILARDHRQERQHRDFIELG